MQSTTSTFNEEQIKELKQLAQRTFPGIAFAEDPLSLETLDKDDFLYQPATILPYLQTMFFEEHLIEFTVNNQTRIYYARLMDDDPERMMEEGDEDEIIDMAEKYEPGSYLQKMRYFLTTPVTPAIGNGHIRNSGQAKLRFYSGTKAIEMPCAFREQVSIDNNPALLFEFPRIGRINKHYRAFRAKTSEATEAKVAVILSGKSDSEPVTTHIADISIGGLAFIVTEELESLEPGDMLTMTIMVKELEDLQVNGTVRQLRKVRSKKGYILTCGVQFDIESQTMATELEGATALIQRLSLREISEVTDHLSGVTIIR